MIPITILAALVMLTLILVYEKKLRAQVYRYEEMVVEHMKKDAEARRLFKSKDDEILARDRIICALAIRAGGVLRLTTDQMGRVKGYYQLQSRKDEKGRLVLRVDDGTRSHRDGGVPHDG